MISKIDHIGIAVKNLDEALDVYREVLGISATGVEEVEEQNVKVAFLPLGESKIELLEATSEDSAIHKFIEKKGEGIQHISFRVKDIVAAIAELKGKGMRLIDEKPKYGAGGAKIAFLHPKGTGGVLIEISER